jgi:hypothetical protein
LKYTPPIRVTIGKPDLSKCSPAMRPKIVAYQSYSRGHEWFLDFVRLWDQRWLASTSQRPVEVSKCGSETQNVRGAFRPAFRFATVKRGLFMVYTLPELLKTLPRIPRQRYAAAHELAVFFCRQVDQTHKGVLEVGIYLLGIVGELLVGWFVGPSEQHSCVQPISIALETSGNLIGLEPAGYADEKALDLHGGRDIRSTK